MQIKGVIDAASAHFKMLDTFENVALKITYEFSIFTVEKLVELINYEETLTTIGSFSVSTGPKLTVFESTSKCRCRRLSYQCRAMKIGYYLQLTPTKQCFHWNTFSFTSFITDK